MLVKTSTWQGRRVLVTGHTGFKGGWLSLWLHQLGAEVTGFSLHAPTEPSLFEQIRLSELLHHIEGDIRDLGSVEAALRAAKPEVVFHLAAQPLVRYSYDNPIETYATNVMGTVHLLDACRRAQSVRAVVAVTSDKCYDNREWVRPYRESHPMGGHDPYSSSKGAAELVISAYRRSYFEQGAGIASVRAGNVVGGGDWATDRLVPDIVRAMLAGERPVIRNPDSVRPWLHVVDALGGYLQVAERLLEGQDEFASAWNFGASEEDSKPVGWIVDRMVEMWDAEGWDSAVGEQPYEAAVLKLDCSKASAALGWRPRLTLYKALEKVVEWHKAVANGDDAREVSLRQLCEYEGIASFHSGEVRA